MGHKGLKGEQGEEKRGWGTTERKMNEEERYRKESRKFNIIWEADFEDNLLLGDKQLLSTSLFARLVHCMWLLVAPYNKRDGHGLDGLPLFIILLFIWTNELFLILKVFVYSFRIINHVLINHKLTSCWQKQTKTAPIHFYCTVPLIIWVMTCCLINVNLFVSIKKWLLYSQPFKEPSFQAPVMATAKASIH